MKGKISVLGNYLFFIAFTALVVAFQCSMWFQFLGNFPAPQLWIPTLIFWFLYRDPVEGMFMTYLICGLLTTQTSLPISQFLIICLLLFGFVYLIKQRIYWSGGSFYTILCGACCFLFFVFELALSYMMEANPITRPQIFAWLTSPILTMIFALPLYFLFHFIDRFSKKEQPREATGGVQ